MEYKLNVVNLRAFLARVVIICTALTSAVAISATATAQSFSTTSTGQQIGPNATCNTANEINLPIVVTGVGAISQMSLGFQATSSYRGDIQIELTSPANTTVRLVSSNGNTSQSNYNIELSDTAPIVINTGTHTTPDGTTAPPYENLVSTNNPGGGGFGNFTGQNANGTWTLNICDAFNADQGNFGVATLYFTSPTDADISLSANLNDVTPDIGDTITLTVTAANAGPVTATGLEAQITIPSGLSFISAGGTGSYNAAMGVWTLPPSLASGTNTSLTIQATVLSSGSTTAVAEISAATQPDPDSTPNNAVTSEDDYDSVSFTPQFGPDGPGLSCPAGNQFAVDWSAPGGAFGWNAGDLTNSYTIGGEDYVLTMTGATNRFIARSFGGSTLQTPVTTNQFEGGNTNGDFGVVMNVDYANTSESVTVTMELGDVGVGVEEMAFGIFDIDNGAWIDQITVNGSLSGTAVAPTLFEGGSSVSVSGNVGTGVGGSASASGDGNLWVRFDNPVDTVTFIYANASTTANPASQVISFQPVTMCPRLLADLSAEKTVEIYDPGNLGLYMIPGNEVLYKISVTNSGTATASAEDVDITDTLPDNLKFVSASTTGFTAGAFGTPALPPANTDCAVTPCVVRFAGGVVPINTTAEIVVRALIK